MTTNRFVATARRILPEGKELPEEEWNARHRAILYVIGAHAIGLLIFGLAMRVSVVTAMVAASSVAVLGICAALPRTPRRMRSGVAALALVTASAEIVQFSGGYIEAHFHFFVVLAVIALYMDWAPFLLAILYVAVDHGIVGTLFPGIVYNHPDAFAHPWKWALIHATLVLGESVALLMGWKVAEEARRRTALVLDSAGEGIIGLDLDGAITFANPAAATMTQLPLASLHARPIDELLVRAENGDGLRVRRADGTLVAVECERTPIRNNDVVIGAVLTLKDITERKRAEDALRRAVSTLSATLESTTDGILVIDQKRRIAGYNKKFVDMWSIPPDILSAADDLRALGFVQRQVNDGAGFLRKVEELYDAPEETSFDIIDFNDGRVFERYSQPQRLEGQVIGRVWSFRDVTERVKAEAAMREQAQLQATNERLREMDRIKTQFINNAAHELGTPLTPIKLQTHMLRAEQLGPLNDRQKRSVVVLSRNVDQLGLLLRDVIDSARVQTGKLDVHLAHVDLARLAAESLESFAELATQSGIEMRLAAEPVEVEADAARLTQVIFNLLRNALKFTPTGGHVTVVVRRAGEQAILEVRDDGAGLAADDIPKLFKAFSQVHDKMETTHSGTGLGLYVARGIIESHGGSIECESGGAGQGATFRVSLPIA